MGAFDNGFKRIEGFERSAVAYELKPVPSRLWRGLREESTFQSMQRTYSRTRRCPLSRQSCFSISFRLLWPGLQRKLWLDKKKQRLEAIIKRPGWKMAQHMLEERYPRERELRIWLVSDVEEDNDDGGGGDFGKRTEQKT